MRILGFNRLQDRGRGVAADIAYLRRARQPGGRICGNHCTARCARCGSTTCLCRCGPDCPDAAQALSSEPDRYPIEPAILPLVFALKRSRVFEPCWSCEGHSGADGSFWKAPMVWFYCRSMLYLRLLSDGVNRMKGLGGLRAPWQVAVTYCDPVNPNTAFSLQPLISDCPDLSLPELQGDAREIARMLETVMDERARSLIP